jgi:hypothetical protein
VLALRHGASTPQAGNGENNLRERLHAGATRYASTIKTGISSLRTDENQTATFYIYEITMTYRGVPDMLLT